MVMGVMSYLSSPLWLLMLIVSATALVPYDVPDSDKLALLQLVIATLILLYAPKFLALGIALRDANQVRAHGGAGALLRSVLGESLFATLFAPVVMLAHSWYVISILMGISTGWGSQARDDRALPLWFVIRHYWPHTLIGIACSFLLWRYAPGDLYWFAPLLLGLCLAIPMARITSSLRLGEAAARRKLFLIPSETVKLPVLERAHRLRAAQEEEGRDFRRLVLEDETVRALHLAMLMESPPLVELPREQLQALAEAAKRNETKSFSRADWIALLSDPDAIAAASSPTGI
jgi:membrane glycosyltransferase